MLELCNALAALTWRVVIVGGALIVVVFVIYLRYLWRHHRDWFGHR